MPSMHARSATGRRSASVERSRMSTNWSALSGRSIRYSIFIASELTQASKATVGSRPIGVVFLHGRDVRRSPITCRLATQRRPDSRRFSSRRRHSRSQKPNALREVTSCGDERDRTVGLLSAIQALSQLSYIPNASDRNRTRRYSTQGGRVCNLRRSNLPRGARRAVSRGRVLRRRDLEDEVATGAEAARRCDEEAPGVVIRAGGHQGLRAGRFAEAAPFELAHGGELEPSIRSRSHATAAPLGSRTVVPSAVGRAGD